MRTSIYSPTSMYTSPFYNEGRYVGKTGYFNGRYKNGYQCVNYAVARSCELSNGAVCYYDSLGAKPSETVNQKPLFKRSGYGNACTWLDDTLWEKGTIPKVGAIMVYGADWGGGYGHVRIVEAIGNGVLTISGANESNDMAFKQIAIPSISKKGFMGYIYNPNIQEENMDLIKIKKEEGYEYKWSVDGNRYGTDYDVTVSAGFGDLDLKNQGYEEVLCVNGSLFYTYEGDAYACGLEKSRGVNNQDLGMACVTKYMDAMAVACVGDELWFASQKWIIDNKLQEAYGAITGLGLLLAGKKCDLHKGFESQWDATSGRTVIGEDKDGNFMSYSFPGTTGSSGKTCAALQLKCLELGFFNAICLDGGGSVFRRYRNDKGVVQYDIATTRKVKNALLLYRRKKQAAVEPPKNDESEQDKAKIESLEKELANTREELNDAKNSLKIAQEKLTKIGDILNG